MKKTLLMFAVAAMTSMTASAQTAIVESTSCDNWFFGIEGGAATKTTHNALLKNVNPLAGIRFGRFFTPSVGLTIEGSAFFRDRQFGESETFVRASNVNILGTVNLSNWFGGYKGAPRPFEVIALAGPGWNHIFGKDASNDITAKVAIDFAFNLGKKRAWQLYLEPGIDFNLDHFANHSYFNINNSALQLLVGLNYKFKNSNGTHYFKKGVLRDQNEIDQLNSTINDLRAANDAKAAQMSNDAKTIKQLKAELEAAKNVKPVQNIVKQVVNNNVLQPTVIFGLGKSTVDAAQMASVAMVAKYMKNHPNARLLIKGYASPEGNPELNQKLSEKRAQSVKDVLVKRYSVAADRLEVKGMGATDELFDEIDFNRVATFTDLTK